MSMLTSFDVLFKLLATYPTIDTVVAPKSAAIGPIPSSCGEALVSSGETGVGLVILWQIGM